MQTLSLRRAIRALFRSPFVTIIAIASLALGIGANAAIFSLFEQFLIRPLPVQAPERLVNLATPDPKPGSTSCNQAGGCDEVFSYPMFRDLQREQTPFTDIAAHGRFGTNLAYRGETISAGGEVVSGSYFPVLGLEPALGRLLEPADDRTIGEAPVVVLSHHYWRSRLDEDPTIINDTLIVNGQALTIVGVAPAGFTGATLGLRPYVFVPLSMIERLGVRDDLDARRSYWLYLFARLQPGTSLAQAHTAVNIPYGAILNDVEAPLQEGMSEQTLARFRTREVTLAEGATGQSSLDENAQAPLLLLFGVTALVLVSACSNIANLLLARGATRAAEMSVRLSLGANRGQLIGQLLLEACVLASLGAAAGLFVARWTLGLIMSFLPAQAAAGFPMTLDTPAFVFTGVLALGTGVLFGLFPAWQSTRPDLVTTLKQQAGQTSGSRSAARFRTTLATVQIGLSMVLLVSAGLFTKSLYNVSRVELGVDIDQLVTFSVSPNRNGYTPEQSQAFFARLEEELRTMKSQVRDNVFVDRAIGVLSAAFAGLATLLAAVGMYGVLAYTVAQRTQEIGLRIALSADPGAVRGLVMRQVTWMTLVGGVAGLAAAVGLGRAARSLLFELQNNDPMVLFGSAVALGALVALVALGAGAVPALRASRIEPMIALRHE